MTADLWDPDRADGAHAVLARLADHPADRAVAAALLALPDSHVIARDSTGPITAPLLLTQLLNQSISGADIALLLTDAGAIRPDIGPAEGGPQ